MKKKYKNREKIGKGAGKTEIVSGNNIVKCNKHDKNMNYITKKQFLFQNSDCSKSIKLGLIATSDLSISTLPHMKICAAVFGIYWRSVYCVIESIQGVVKSSHNNIYCNGKRKSGGHYNCSWFRGIGHSESFHTHKY